MKKIMQGTGLQLFNLYIDKYYNFKYYKIKY